MHIEILYIEGCPNHRLAVEEVSRVLNMEGMSAQIESIMVSDSEAAHILHFLGSPTIRIEGIDVEPAARSSRDYAYACRTYQTTGRQAGFPPESLIRQAIREARGREGRQKT